MRRMSMFNKVHHLNVSFSGWELKNFHQAKLNQKARSTKPRLATGLPFE